MRGDGSGREGGVWNFGSGSSSLVAGRIEFRGLVSLWYNSRKRGKEGEEGEQMFMGRVWSSW
jgi:hypothetical protein